MTTLVCPVGPGDENPELRYAIRSWEKNLLLPDPHLVTVGYKPTWLEPDLHIEGNEWGSPEANVFENVRRASGRLVGQTHGDVIYMNDDFFCLDPTASIFPVRRDMTLAEHRRSVKNADSWGSSLDLTASWLMSKGFPHPYSYEVHRPLLADPQDMALALYCANEAGLGGTVQWRTVYGTLNEVDAVPVKDVKASVHYRGFGSGWFSTDHWTWRVFGQDIAKGFQKPSHWER